MLEPGFYEWDGVPCRVVSDEDAFPRAEVYVRGGGFSEVDLVDVFREGVKISEARFKTMVLCMTQKAPNGF